MGNPIAVALAGIQLHQALMERDAATRKAVYDDLMAWANDQVQALPEHRTPAAHGSAEALRNLRTYIETRRNR